MIQAQHRSTAQTLYRSAQALQDACAFSESAARGTLRLALKNAGFAPEQATPTDIDHSIREYMPEVLRVRGVRNPLAVCRRLLSAVQPDSRH